MVDDNETIELLSEVDGDGIDSPSTDDLLNKALDEFQECIKRVDRISGAGPGVSTCGSVAEIGPRVLVAQEQTSRKVRVHPGVDFTKIHPLYYPTTISRTQKVVRLHTLTHPYTWLVIA